MSLGYDQPLYILASDHRTSFQTKLFGIEGTPSAEQRAQMATAKRIILQGLLIVAEDAEPGTLGALLDEEHGAAGMDTAADYRLVADAARAGGRDDVGCVVLGAGADEATVAHWLREAAVVDGFIGFAIGRTIFWEPLKRWIAGTADADTAATMIADNYRRTIDVYTSTPQPA